MVRIGGAARVVVLLGLAACTSITAEAEEQEGYHFVPGSFEAGKGPNGNSVFLGAPEGLLLVDTGRHAEHQEKLLAYAKQRGKPIAAIVNTHWHLDHSGGNAEVRAAYPRAKVYASTAIEGALKDFFPKSRAAAEDYLKSGKAPPEQAAEIRRDFAAMDDPDSLRATEPVTASRKIKIAGRPLTVNLAPYAATEGDIWLYDEANRLAIVGDLVVAMVPFMDTACPEGWRKALDAIAAMPFTTLIPGHGDPMTRARFLAWRGAFGNLLDCAASDQPKEACVVGWKRDAAAFIPAGEKRVEGMIAYYLDTRLRAAPEERDRWCPKP
jgi:glyoxylase-like metal-dependent hydrolase (beta-lactamase superfamily II)